MEHRHGTDTLDRAALERLCELIGGDRAALRELVESFLEEGTEIVDSLHAALLAEDRDALHRGAHSLKSGAQDMGAERLRALAATLEADARESWPPDAAVAVGAVDTAFADARRELERWLAQ